MKEASKHLLTSAVTCCEAAAEVNFYLNLSSGSAAGWAEPGGPAAQAVKVNLVQFHGHQVLVLAKRRLSGPCGTGVSFSVQKPFCPLFS